MINKLEQVIKQLMVQLLIAFQLLVFRLLKDYSQSGLDLLNQPLLVVDKIWNNLLSEVTLVFNISFDSVFEIQWYLHSSLSKKLDAEFGFGTADEIMKFAPIKWSSKLIPTLGDAISITKMFSENEHFDSWRTQDDRYGLNDSWIMYNPIVYERELICDNKLVIVLAEKDYSDK